MAVVAEKLITAEEFLAMPGVGKMDELVRGRMVKVTPSGGEHTWVAAQICTAINLRARSTRSGFCTVEAGGYMLSRDPDTVRCPDVGYIRRDRVPDGRLPKGFIEGAPDLAVEVVSPSQPAAELDKKVREYLEAGSRLVWVVYPEERAARVWRADGTTEWIPEDAALSGEDVLPGFTLPLTDVFE